jgi:hypothetical protein
MAAMLTRRRFGKNVRRPQYVDRAGEQPDDVPPRRQEGAMTSVPFTIGVYGGLGDCHGLVRPDGDALVLEFQVQDNFVGLIRGTAKTVRIPLKDLEAVELRGRWLTRSLVIQARSLLAVAAVPGSRQGRVELTIARDDVPAAERLVAGVYE